MIYREMQPVSVVSFTSGTDAYGQKRKNGSSSRVVDMFIRTYSQINVADVRYADVTDIGLTTDTAITDENQIEVGEQTYQVLYVIPSRRFYQILMKRV